MAVMVFAQYRCASINMLKRVLRRLNPKRTCTLMEMTLRPQGNVLHRSLSQYSHISSAMVSNTLHHLNGGRSLHGSTSVWNDSNTTSEFKEVIYRHSNMRVIRFINNIKIFQTLVAVIYVPWGFYLNNMNQMSDFVLYFQTGITLFALLMLYAMSYYLRRIVGVLYINQDQDKLKISHLTFWGQRQDDILNVSDVVPFGEDMESRIERFKKIKLSGADSSKFYYIDTKAGEIRNIDKFEDVFGNLLKHHSRY